MLVYRVPLDGPGWRVLGVTAAGRGPCRVTVRLADAAGAVRTHRGTVHILLPGGQPLVMAGYQVSAGELLISLRPAPRAPEAVTGVAVTDRFRLPLGLQAWGVTAVRAARPDLSAVVRAGRGRLLVRGALRILLETPGAAFPLRIPFARLIPAETPPGLTWRLAAGVAGLHLRVGAGGRVEGEAVVALRCEGRPGAPPPLAELQSVREVEGRVDRVTAEEAGPGCVTVRGVLEADIYWLDRSGCSRWTGRAIPFTVLLPVDGPQPGDRLEATARVERLTFRDFRLHGLVHVTCTALRCEQVVLGGRTYRLDRVVEVAGDSVAVSDWVGGSAPGWQAITSELPLPGPAVGWQEIAAVLASPALTAGPGEARWRVAASLGGTPLDEPPYPAPLRAGAQGRLALAPGAAAAAVPGLTEVSERGMQVRTVLTWGQPLPAAAAVPAEPAEPFDLPLPGPARRIVDLRLEGARLRTLVALEARRLHFDEAKCAATRITAFVMRQDDRWLLRCVPGG